MFYFVLCLKWFFNYKDDLVLCFKIILQMSIKKFKLKKTIHYPCLNPERMGKNLKQNGEKDNKNLDLTFWNL